MLVGRAASDAEAPNWRRQKELNGSALLLLPQLRIQRRRPQRHVGAIAQRHGHLSGRALDLDVAEELHSSRRRQVLLVRSRGLDEFHLGPEGVVEFVRPERAGMQGAETNSQNGSKS